MRRKLRKGKTMQVDRLRLRIVGLPYHDAREVWDACEAGLISHNVTLTSDNMIPLELRPEPTNQNDPNAIQVYLDPMATGGRDFMLGYVPKQDTGPLHAMMAVAGHLGAAIEIDEVEEPVERSMWRALIETDRPDFAAGKFSTKAQVPAPVWRNQIKDTGSAQTPAAGKPAAVKARPKRRQKLVHDWF
tara:strand:- start:565 stop:1128 length:564 start_codon:yes stop_codon:yes gene_type:complete